MKTKIKRRSRITNPTNLQFIGQQYLDKPEMQLFTYDADSFDEKTDIIPKDFMEKGEKGRSAWFNLHGIHNPEVVTGVCKDIAMPLFAIQDIIDTSQRTRLQRFDDYIFFSLKSILPSDDLKLEIEQITFILGKNALYSFQEKKADHFEHIRVRIRENNGLVRKKGPDFLMFLLIESILENYYSTLDRLEEAIKVDTNPLESGTNPKIIHEIEASKRKLLQIRKNLIAMRDALQRLQKEEFQGIIDEVQKKYYFDLRDNCLNILESLDALELRLDSSENLYFSLQGHRMNQVMTTLTIMAAIFIPLTFLAGIYGMNFEYMPELKWHWGYFMVLGVMFIVTILLLIYFKRRKWF